MEKPYDPVSAPSHYHVRVQCDKYADGWATVECKDLMYALGLGYDFWTGAAFKYLFRATRKDNMREDFGKCVECLSNYLHRKSPNLESK